MKRRDVLETLARYRGMSPAVVGPGFGGRILHEIDHQPATIYNMEFGYPVAVCLGLALALPQERVFAVEGDGSLIAALGTLTTVARYAPRNLIILAIDNRSFATTGAQPTASASATDIAAVGRAAGLVSSMCVADMAAVETALARAVESDGPHLIVAEVEHEDVRSAGRSKAYPFDIVEAAITFRRSLENRGLVPTIWAV
ncbi:thiamine pyrophosphate-dependent enzyme [Streptomyces sp. NBC_01320]|uniref:thiamine pyrophosphate-dependent enzyme n=1 Tax=Streptomyces sp. NBC_01320 TaxID=2903824 RepID=UPI002E108E4D|nr:thiamine pyrophosphate-dependent enzyme [Streptomyces sp. NBC_01320]